MRLFWNYLLNKTFFLVSGYFIVYRNSSHTNIYNKNIHHVIQSVPYARFCTLAMLFLPETYGVMLFILQPYGIQHMVETRTSGAVSRNCATTVALSIYYM